MKNLFSAIISSSKGRLGGVLFALLATTSLWAHDFEVDGIYYNYLEGNNVEVTYEGNDSFEYDNEYSDAITIPSTVTYNGNTYSVTSIGDDAFSGCSSLANITIPNSVTSIGGAAFEGCSALTTIVIPYSVTIIGFRAFAFCSSLESIVVDPLNLIYDSRNGCNAIVETNNNVLLVGCKNTIIPNNICRIDNLAFSGCSAIETIAIPNSVIEIGGGAFVNCSSLASIIFPVSLIKIEENAFGHCVSLNSVTIPNSVKIIESWTFSYCTSLTSITIPDGVTTLGNLVFYECSSLATIDLDNTLTTINWGLLANCTALSSVKMFDGVTDIGYEAFLNCSSLCSIVLPDSVTSIQDYAFKNCSSLTTVICKAIEVPELGSSVFKNVPLSNTTLYVPAHSLDDYKAADQWKDFGTILPIEESEEEIELHDTEMTIVFTNSEDNDSDIYRETITIKVPTAPTIAGFTFLYWQPVAEPITNEITIQAIYEADTPTSAEVYTNPANPVQKLLRNGQVYILQDGKTYTVMGQRL
jgi:hypothetical protein